MTEPIGCNFAAENQRYYSSKFWSYDHLHSHWLFRLAFGSRWWCFNWQESRRHVRQKVVQIFLIAGQHSSIIHQISSYEHIYIHHFSIGGSLLHLHRHRYGQSLFQTRNHLGCFIERLRPSGRENLGREQKRSAGTVGQHRQNPKRAVGERWAHADGNGGQYGKDAGGTLGQRGEDARRDFGHGEQITL